jgi:pimeloyl-ACP methyl ester carboxylesterase
VVQADSSSPVAPGAKFKEGFVEADGFRIRYREAGEGEPLVHFHGGGGMLLYPSHDLLAESHRVILFEVPGFGQSPVNDRTQSMAELASTMAQAVANLGIERYSVMGNSFGGKLALCLAVQCPERLKALILVAPAAIRLEGAGPPSDPADRARMLYAHPERQPTRPPTDPEIVAKQQALTRRLIGPPRDEELEQRMATLDVPVLLLFGTLDRMAPSELGRLYCEKLPNCSFVLVYDAAHEVDADRPEAFVALANDFLERQGGFLVSQHSSRLFP